MTVAIPIKVYCPKCNHRHVDRDEWATPARAHHKHLCESCGNLWTPHPLDTVGVEWEPRLGYFELLLGQRCLGLTWPELFEAAALAPRPVLILGEAPTPRTRIDCPMFPHPTTSAGGRLLMMSGMGPLAYLRAFDREDLLPSSGWNVKNAHEAAKLIAARWRGRTIVLCGERVAAAFGYRGPSYAWTTLYETRCVRIPHPSGRNSILNTTGERGRVRRALDEALREP